MVNQRCTSTRLRQAVATELPRRAYYLTELALAATPQELAMVPDLWDGAEVSFATRDTVWALEHAGMQHSPRNTPRKPTDEAAGNCVGANRMRNTAANYPPTSTFPNAASRSPHGAAVSPS